MLEDPNIEVWGGSDIRNHKPIIGGLFPRLEPMTTRCQSTNLKGRYTTIALEMEALSEIMLT